MAQRESPTGPNTDESEPKDNSVHIGGKNMNDDEELRKQIESELLQYKAELSQGLNQLASGKTATLLSTDRLMQLIKSREERLVREARIEERNRLIRVPKEADLSIAPQPIDPTHVPLEYRWVTFGAYYDQRNRKASNKWYDEHKHASAIIVNQDGDALYALYTSPLASHNESVDHLFKTMRAVRYFEDEIAALKEGE